ncbi:MAG: hypothetical protein V9G09_02940 [Candidatus Nanopelagicales bacterium]
MAVSGRRSGGRGVCQPLATWGCNGHAVNDTILAHAQLLVDAPERIGPIQAIGMDQTLFNREYRTQQWATTFDFPPKSEVPHDSNAHRRNFRLRSRPNRRAKPCDEADPATPR